jgi:alkylation response protein AidB-like acyl-CoA dehydrogenase
VNFTFSDEQELLRETARKWLADRSPSSVVRALMETEGGFDQAMWRELADLGWLGMAIPENYGGAGFGFLEVVVLLEEMGRVLLPAPFFSTVVVAVPTLLAAGSDDQKAEHLPAIAAGSRRAALALTEPNGRWDVSGVETTYRPDGGSFVLNGTKSFVVDGHTADLLIVAARRPGSAGDEGISLFLVPQTHSGVASRRLETMDMTRKLAEVVLTEVRVGREALLGSEGGGGPVVERVLQKAVAGLAAEQVGGAQRCLDMAVEYAKVRVQFGRPIGSFQAIKHKCADMLVQVEGAKSAAYYAGWAAAEDNEELAEVSHIAKSYCSEAYFLCASENIQIHGGIGFTWDHDAHLYFKRAKSSELIFGDPAYHRRALARLLGL